MRLAHWHLGTKQLMPNNPNVVQNAIWLTHAVQSPILPSSFTMIDKDFISVQPSHPQEFLAIFIHKVGGEMSWRHISGYLGTFSQVESIVLTLTVMKCEERIHWLLNGLSTFKYFIQASSFRLLIFLCRAIF